MNEDIVETAATRARRGLPRSSIATLAALLLALGACGGDNKPKAAGQAVARVNDVEITIHQVNNELMRLGVKGGADNHQATKRVLDALIDQQLLVQQATDAKLDRDPQVMQTLDQTRRQLLSQAYLERNLGGQRPSPEEVKKFYAENPTLFEKRRIYSFRDFAIERSQFSDALRAKLDQAKTPADVAAALKSMNISYQEAPGVRGAEQMPIEMLPKVSTMAKGDIALLSSSDRIVLMQLVDSTERPLTLAQATPYIEQFLTISKKRQLAESKLKELRAAAKIAYLGAFEQGAEDQKQQSRPHTDAPPGDVSKPLAQNPQPQSTAPAGEGSKPTPEAHDESLRKGLRGLR